MLVGALVTPVVYSTLHFYTISRPNSLIFRQNFFEKSSNGKSWVKEFNDSLEKGTTLIPLLHLKFLRTVAIIIASMVIFRKNE